MNEKYFKDLDLKIQEEVHNSLILGKLGDNFNLLIIYGCIVVLFLIIFFTAQMIIDYFYYLQQKNVVFIYKSNNINLSENNETLNNKSSNLNLFENIIYPILAVYVCFLEFVENILEFIDDFIPISFVIFFSFFAILISIFAIDIYNTGVKEDIYTLKLNEEFKINSEELSYPVVNIESNKLTNTYKIHYLVNNDTLEISQIGSIKLDKNLNLDNDSIGIAKFSSLNKLFDIYNSVNKSSLSNTFIDKFEMLMKSYKNGLIIEEVKIKEAINF